MVVVIFQRTNSYDLLSFSFFNCFFEGFKVRKYKYICMVYLIFFLKEKIKKNLMVRNQFPPS
jgi:hypothetical protein